MRNNTDTNTNSRAAQPRKPASGGCALRTWLRGLLFLGFAGTGAELLLLDHTEGFWQKVPLGVVVLGLVALAAHAFSERAACRRAFQGTMLLALAGGVAGLVLHFRGNMEFELEMQPNNTGWPLVWKTLKGATPALAPGMMLLLGLLGLATTSPALATERNAQPITPTGDPK